MFTLEEKIACLEREIKRRQRVFPNRIMTRRMTSKTAYRELETMKQILDDLLAIQEKELADGDLFSRGVVDSGP